MLCFQDILSALHRFSSRDACVHDERFACTANFKTNASSGERAVKWFLQMIQKLYLVCFLIDDAKYILC
jgi:hypothetical protein